LFFPITHCEVTDVGGYLSDLINPPKKIFVDKKMGTTLKMEIFDFPFFSCKIKIGFIQKGADHGAN